MIDDTKLLAWIDGELPAPEAARVAAAVAADEALAARAEAHRGLARRLSAGFAPLLDAFESGAAQGEASANVISLADARTARTAAGAARSASGASPENRWLLFTALAATLVIGVVAGSQSGGPHGVADAPGALVASASLSGALDRQLAGRPGPIRVSLSFRDRAGDYCRSFTGSALAGIACRDETGWRLRYAAAASELVGAYRTAAAGDPALLAAADAMISGKPLNAEGERMAQSKGWMAH